MNQQLRTLLIRSKTVLITCGLFILNFIKSFVIGCRIPQFLRSTKVVLIKICAWGIWTRLFQISAFFGIIIFGILWLAREMFRTMCWFLLNCIDLVLIIPLFIVWIFTGKNLIFKLEEWVNDKTGFFDCMYEKY